MARPRWREQVSQFKRDMTEKMRDPEYAYEFGRTERELEIIQLLEEQIMKIETQIDLANPDDGFSITLWTADIDNLNTYIALIKGENK